MRRRFSLHPEIVERLDQTRPEKRRPVTIRDDASGQRVVTRHQPAGKFETILRSITRERMKCLGNASFNLNSGLQIFAAVMQKSWTRILGWPLGQNRQLERRWLESQVANLLCVVSELRRVHQEFVPEFLALLVGQHFVVKLEQSFDFRRPFAGNDFGRS